MTDSQQLLTEYRQNGSDAAFRELVTRYVDLVYSTALRLVEGDTHRAEDVAQTVFVDLARKARTLPLEIRLGGWLHRDACLVAGHTMRGERRRQSRERQAVEMNVLQNHSEADFSQVAPLLDGAINELGEADRTAILLRFFEQQDFRAVGQALGSNEDAARMRVNRALEKLESLLNQRGVTTSAGALAIALSDNAVQAAPVGLAVTISTAAALAGTTLATTATATATKAIAMTTLQKALVIAIVVASLVAPLVVQHQTQARLHDQEESARQQTAQLAKLRQENDGLSNRLAQTITSAALSQDQRNELLKLRGDVGRLRTDVRNYTKIAAFREEIAQLPLEKVWPARVSRLKQWLEEHPSEKVPELNFAPQRRWLNSIYPIPMETDEECRRAMSIVRENSEASTRNNLAEALRQYAKDHDGQFPAELSQLKPLCNPPLDDEVLGRYTILPASSLVSEMRPIGDWVITEKTPVSEADDIRHAIGLGSSRDANRQVTNRWTLLQ